MTPKRTDIPDAEHGVGAYLTFDGKASRRNCRQVLYVSKEFSNAVLQNICAEEHVTFRQPRCLTPAGYRVRTSIPGDLAVDERVNN